VSVPLVVATTAMLTSIVMGASDRALLLGLPGLAVLAAFALPTLNRSTSAAIDWFSMILFTLLAGALWAIYLSVQTGTPAQPAANVRRLAPGFVPSFSVLALVVALAATVCWVWVVRWRTGRHREALWKSLVLPAGGVTLCWLLLTTLGMPILDYARSTRAVVERVVRHVPRGSCIAAPGQARSLVAGLEYHGRYRVDASDGAARSSCGFLVRIEPRSGMPAPGAGWTLVARESRPSDRNNWVAIYRRAASR
jgi:4-amino-4-deoxy-L-arabinose transferase-like glycosyltransferase